MKAWAWDRAENYNVKEADHENDNKAKTLHDTKVLTSDRFMDKILKPSGLGWFWEEKSNLKKRIFQKYYFLQE